MDKKYDIVLASGSPRRREILNQIGAEFRIITSDKEEIIDDIAPADMVKKLASMKAADVALRVPAPAVIIGADTVVAYKNRLLGKPKNEADAFNMLRSFTNDIHYVHTGVSIIIKDSPQKQRELSFEVSTLVKVTDMTDEQIRQYIATGEPMDKAGAYAIQGLFAPYIERVEGDYYNIVGFPISSVYHTLLNEGIDIIPRNRHSSDVMPQQPVHRPLA